MRINISEITNWKVATKTKNLRAKPLVNLLVDKSVVNKFLVDTLEGKEPLGDGTTVICIGESGDIWQQTPKKLLSKYNVTSIDKDGWMVCDPKLDNAVNSVESEYAEFTIIGQWGETIGDEKNVQRGTRGDYICQNQSDPTDVWIVRKKIFENSYTIKYF